MANKHLHFIVGGGNNVFYPKFGLAWPYIFPQDMRFAEVFVGTPFGVVSQTCTRLFNVLSLFCCGGCFSWQVTMKTWERRRQTVMTKKPRGEKRKNPIRKTKRQKRMNKIYAEFLDIFFTQLFFGQYFGKCIQVSGLHWLCYLVSTCFCLERLFCFDSLNCSGKEAIL